MTLPRPLPLPGVLTSSLVGDFHGHLLQQGFLGAAFGEHFPAQPQPWTHWSSPCGTAGGAGMGIQAGGFAARGPGRATHLQPLWMEALAPGVLDARGSLAVFVG